MRKHPHLQYYPANTSHRITATDPVTPSPSYRGRFTSDKEVNDQEIGFFFRKLRILMDQFGLTHIELDKENPDAS